MGRADISLRMSLDGLNGAIAGGGRIIGVAMVCWMAG
jgi:hypothetical protein